MEKDVSLCFDKDEMFVGVFVCLRVCARVWVYLQSNLQSHHYVNLQPLTAI